MKNIFENKNYFLKKIFGNNKSMYFKWYLILFDHFWKIIFHDIKKWQMEKLIQGNFFHVTFLSAWNRLHVQWAAAPPPLPDKVGGRGSRRRAQRRIAAARAPVRAGQRNQAALLAPQHNCAPSTPPPSRRPHIIQGAHFILEPLC